MKIKINNKDFEIKPATELTVKEYVDIFRNSSGNDFEMLIKYISVVTNVPHGDVSKINIDANTIRRLLAYIGKIKKANEIEQTKEFYYRKFGKTLYQKTIDWQTLGARGMIESFQAETQAEQAVYLLAIYIQENYDKDKVDEIYEDLQSYNANEVLGFIVFFFRKLYSGKKKESGFLNRFLKKRKTNTRKR